jgi:RNA polymerase sigma factor (sigma-70 family)
VEETPGPPKADYSKNSLACYLNETGRFCLLSVIEERELGRVLDLEKYFNLLEAEYTATYGVQPLASDVCLILLKSILRDYPLVEELCVRTDLNSSIPISCRARNTCSLHIIAPVKVERLLNALSLEPLSLENPVGEEGDHLGDFIEDQSIPKPEVGLEQALLKRDIGQVLDRLSEREREVVELRFGLIDGHEWTLKKVSTRLGITRERVRQIQNIALNTLRNPDISRNLKDYL